MSPNTFDPAEKNNNGETKFKPQTPFDFCLSERKGDKSASEDLVSLEKAENEVWLGVKAENLGNLELAASHYRLAIESHSECVRAYRLLSSVLKKIRKVRSNDVVGVEYEQEKVAELTETINAFWQNRGGNDREIALEASKTIIKKDKEVIDRAEVTIAQPNAEVLSTDIIQLTKKELTDSATLDFSNVNLIPVTTNLNVSNIDSSQQKNQIVLLPDVEISPSGDMVLQNNLAVSQVYVEQALAFFEQKQWDKSIAACKEALRICPSIAEAYKIWGNCLQQSGNSADAIGIYAKALELQPNMAEIYCNLGSIYAKGKKWHRAIEYYQKSTIVDPNCAAPYRNLARVWDKLGEYEKSEECFFKALAIKPELISAKNHFELAHYLAVEENKRDLAIACYKSCISLEPQFLNAYVRVAQLLEEDGQTEEALYYYKKLAQLQTKIGNEEHQPKYRKQIHKLLFGNNKKSAPALPEDRLVREKNKKQVTPQLTPARTAETQKTLDKEEKIARYTQQVLAKPNSAPAHIKLGNLYFLDRQWQNAISYYLKGIKLAPKEAKYYINLGKAWEKLGDEIKANQAFYQGFSLEPEKVTAQNHLLLGNKLLEQRQIKPAIACYRRAITRQPTLIEAYWQLGKILAGGGKHQGAIACYQQALKVDPKNAKSYFWLGNVLTHTKQFSAATSCYQKAAEIEPENADIQHNLGEALYEERKWHDAIEAYERAIALNPHNSWSHNNLGNALLKTEQWQQAADSYRRAIELKPEFVWSHYNLGEALSALEQWSEALSAYKAAQQLDSELPRIKQKMGAILHRRSRNSQQEALSYCQAQIEADPDNIELYHQAISLDRKNHQLYLGLGKALFKQGKIDEAIAILQMGLKIQPTNLELSAALSEAILEKHPQLELKDVAERVGELINSSPNFS